jgi:hypothetical protein
MRLPLIVGGVSRKVTNCAIVRIPQGDWRLVVENWIDSVLELSPVPSVDNNLQFHLKEPTALQLCIKVPGNETNLNIYVERLDSK